MTDVFIVEVAHLSVRRGQREVVRDVSLKVAAGERVALVGPNAAGKSTLLSSLAGLLPDVVGDIWIEGRSLPSFSGRGVAKVVALVVALQEGAPRLSVLESTELGRYPHTGPLQGLSAKDREAVRRSLAETELEQLQERSIGSLSAGERQRAMIARALAQEPGLLLLDEPSAHLDVGHSLDLFSLLTSIAGRGMAIVAVIHDLASAARWATRMVVMHEGRIVDDGPPTDVMTGPALGQAFGISIIETGAARKEQPSSWRFERAARSHPN